MMVCIDPFVFYVHFKFSMSGEYCFAELVVPENCFSVLCVCHPATHFADVKCFLVLKFLVLFMQLSLSVNMFYLK